MFRLKKEAAAAGAGIADRVAGEAEALFRSGKFHCAEAVLSAVKTTFAPELPDEVIGVAAGFGGGSNSGCLCGAVSGGTIAFGLVLGRDRKGVANLTRQLHLWFKEEYLATCCKLITSKGKSGCARLTGHTARKTAELLLAHGCTPRPAVME